GYSGRFTPFVTMSRNLIPFEIQEAYRYRFSFMFIKSLIIRRYQTHSLRHAHGVIFLNDYAKRVVLKVVKQIRGTCAIIPHGVDNRFFRVPRKQKRLGDYSPADPFRLLYVSTVDAYKHQWNVVEA